MLVIRRRAGERLLIGDSIEIEVLEISPTRVKLGIVAPDSCTVMRKEVQITRNENLNASRSFGHDLIRSLANKLSR
jgi:carbon storage regulator